MSFCRHVARKRPEEMGIWFPVQAGFILAQLCALAREKRMGYCPRMIRPEPFLPGALGAGLAAGRRDTWGLGPTVYNSLSRQAFARNRPIE
jgi:hypothetical protein